MRARACSARYIYGLGIGGEEWSRIRWSFYRQGCNIVALAGERWRQLKPRNFLRIAIRREPRARARARILFCILLVFALLLLLPRL